MASYICSNCNSLLKTKNSIALGSTLKCPRCKKPFVVEEEYEEDAPERSSCLSTCLTTIFLLLILCCSGVGLSGWWWFHDIKGWLRDMDVIAKENVEANAEDKAKR